MAVYQLIASIVVVLLIIIFYFFILRSFKKLTKVKSFSALRMKNIRRFVNVLVLILLSFALFAIWGVNIQNAFVFVGSLFALVAIGFFAVWSILSNILAGFIFYLTKVYEIGDEIKIFPEKIGGRIIEMSLFFLVLEENRTKKKIVIPNNLVFQKIITKKQL